MEKIMSKHIGLDTTMIQKVSPVKILKCIANTADISIQHSTSLLLLHRTLVGSTVACKCFKILVGLLLHDLEILLTI